MNKRTCALCGVSIDHRPAHSRFCGDLCAARDNRTRPGYCECGTKAVKRVGGGWACQRCLDIEAMNALAERKRHAMRERESRMVSLDDAWGGAWG